MNVEHWWNDIDRGKPKYSVKKIVPVPLCLPQIPQVLALKLITYVVVLWLWFMTFGSVGNCKRFGKTLRPSLTSWIIYTESSSKPLRPPIKLHGILNQQTIPWNFTTAKTSSPWLSFYLSPLISFSFLPPSSLFWYSHIPCMFIPFIFFSIRLMQFPPLFISLFHSFSFSAVHSSPLTFGRFKRR